MAVFFDRDGVLAKERNYLSKPERLALIPGSIEAIQKISSLGMKKVILTNQSGIGRGLFTVLDYDKVMQRMRALFAEKGAFFDGEYYCPHAPWEGCDCRKPLPGLALRAAKDLDIELSRSFVIGDKRSDMGLARAIGAKGILVRTGYGRQTEMEGDPLRDVVVDDIEAAAEVICRWIEEEENGVRDGRSSGRDDICPAS
ncbi:MAG: HAD family hydrolase [Synergistales bacterium]|nr:HAD family hydrolase [Synergistales bacterium]